MTYRYAIIGDPIGHSLSPILHGAAFTALGIDATYESILVRPEDLRNTIAGRLSSEFDGFNVTLPHKSAVIPLLDDVDAFAASVGAVNTVVRRHGRLGGTNTDVLGIRRSLQPYLASLRDKPAVIIGAGGTARSAIAALAEDVHPAQLSLLVRDPDRASGPALLARNLLACPLRVVRLDDAVVGRALADAALIIQTTPVGMTPDTARSPLPTTHRFSPDQTVFDVIYRPLETALLTAARADGARVIGGLELFLEQGAAAFELWTGRAMPMDVVRPAVLRALDR
jgi:shikimate dehydrogenase